MRLGFGPGDWDLGLETGIWASRLGFEGGGRRRRRRRRRRKSPIYVKAWVIDPFGAAAQKEQNKQLSPVPSLTAFVAVEKDELEQCRPLGQL